MCPPPSKDPEAEDVGEVLSQPVLGLFAGIGGPARRILLMEVWEILSPLRVGVFL